MCEDVEPMAGHVSLEVRRVALHAKMVFKTTELDKISKEVQKCKGGRPRTMLETISHLTQREGG